MSLMSILPSGKPVVGPVTSQFDGAGGTFCPKYLATRAMSLMSHFPSGNPSGPVTSPTIATMIQPSVRARPVFTSSRISWALSEDSGYSYALKDLMISA